MIQPWQVWLVDFSPTEGHEQDGLRPAVVVSSEFALRLNVGRIVTVAPITSKYRPMNHRIQIANHQGKSNWILTDQIRTISSSRFVRSQPWWHLSDNEIAAARRALSFMVDF